MIYTDYHLHTTLSHDGISTMEEQIENAIDLGLKELCFTEHYDVYEGVINSDLKVLDVKNYVEVFNYYKEKYQSKISLKLGIEIGLQPDIVENIKGMVSNYEFDFIIGSSHITCKKDIASDKSFFDGLTQKEAYLKYFNEVLKNIELFDDFDVYGHLDYIVRYGGYEKKKIEYFEYCEILDKTLKLLVRKEKGIEINTAGYRYGLEYFHPNLEILTRYKELGGKLITIGSDAHKYEDICYEFKKAVDVLKNVGYTHYAIFNSRKPELIAL